MLFAEDPWLTEMLGKRSFAVRIGECAARGVKGAELWDQMGPAPYFAYGKVSSEAALANRWAEENGLKRIEEYVVYEKPTGGISRTLPREFQFRPARAADEEALAALAASTFRADRFHSDPRVGEKTASRIKEEWVRNFFRGKRGEGMIVVEAGGKPVGFLQYLRSGETLVIDLIAVAQDFGRRGIAEGLVTTAQAANPACRVIRAGTQAANPAVRFYENTGFHLASSGYTYHRHHPEAA